MHNRGPSGEFQPFGVTKANDTVDDQQMTAPAATEKDTVGSGQSQTKSGEMMDRQWIPISPLVGHRHGLFYAAAEVLAYDLQAYIFASGFQWSTCGMS